MSVTASGDWYKTNYRYLRAEVDRVGGVLEHYIDKQQDQSPQTTSPLEDTTHPIPGNSRLDLLCATLNLNSIERDILLACAGMEIIPNFKQLFTKIHGEPYPTFAVFYKVFPNFNWSVISARSSLQYFSLIEIVEVKAGQLLTQSLLRIDRHILCYLLGEPSCDLKLRGVIKPLQVAEIAATKLQPSHQKIATQLAAIWLETTVRTPNAIVQLCGFDFTAKMNIAATACDCTGCNLHTIKAHALPSKPDEIKALLQRWEREALLSNSILLLECDDISYSELATLVAIQQLIVNINSRLVITSTDSLPLKSQTYVTFDIPKLTTIEQLAIWHSALGTSATELNGQVERLVSQFNLNPKAISTAVETATSILNTNPVSQTDTNKLATVLWDSCRLIARPQLDDLASRIETNATWNDLVLPEKSLQILQNMVSHVRQRQKVYTQWGFANRSGRGLGISALFTGESGLGKTFAAEVVANELSLDLYRIDLSAIVSKYIGETEKNLRRIFDAAETGGAVLLFDEADALFGKRTAVKDSHDRNANMETNYLLQRIEAYQGLAILTTNLSDAIDSAFYRRIRFVVRFEFPLAPERLEMWKRIFPQQTPTEGLDYHKLSRLNATGATIRTIAMNAAFFAAEATEPVMMKHLLAATTAEYSKMGQILSDTQIRGWV